MAIDNKIYNSIILKDGKVIQDVEEGVGPFINIPKDKYTINELINKCYTSNGKLRIAIRF